MAGERQRLLTIALALGLSLVLGWNIHRAGVETKPDQIQVGTVQTGSDGPGQTVTSIWSMPGQQPPAPSP